MAQHGNWYRTPYYVQTAYTSSYHERDENYITTM